MAQYDIPKNVVLVLTVLAIIISILGTWTVLDASGNVPLYASRESNAQGRVSVNIVSDKAASSVPRQDSTQGYVTLALLKPRP